MLYDYIFWVIYSANLEKDKGEWLSRHNASGIVFFSFIVHILLLFTILKKYLNIIVDAKVWNASKWVVYPLTLICITMIYFYFSRRKIDRIMIKFSKDKTYHINKPLVALIIFVPLIACFVIGWRG